MNTAGISEKIQSVYFIRDVRNGVLKEEIVQNCLMCGRCKDVCPVGIDTMTIRTLKRESFKTGAKNLFEYVSAPTPAKADVAYFAGCMGQLTPSITRSMEKIMNTAKERYIFIDKEKTICCGRPLQLNGREKDAANLMKENRDLFLSTGAKILVTSCPFCFRMFNEEYDLGIKVMHHSQYLKYLVDKRKINLKNSDLSIVYHDPCELGRGSGIYDEPRDLMRRLGKVVEGGINREQSVCCGGSLGNVMLNTTERKKLTRQAVDNLVVNNPNRIITGCPVCKKTLAIESSEPVQDIAEIIAGALITERKTVRQPVPVVS